MKTIEEIKYEISQLNNEELEKETKEARDICGQTVENYKTYSKEKPFAIENDKTITIGTAITSFLILQFFFSFKTSAIAAGVLAVLAFLYSVYRENNLKEDAEDYEYYSQILDILIAEKIKRENR